MPYKKEREYRNFLQKLEVRKTDDKKKNIVEGYATTFNQPYELYSSGDYTVREQIDAHAFDDCDMSDVIFQYDHEGRVFARTRNNTLELETDEHGLKIKADLSGTEAGRQLHEEIDKGYTDKMSFAFIVEESKREVTESENKTDILRTITKVKKIYDVSAVSIPANDGTEIYSARSYFNGLIEELETERLRVEKRQRDINILKLKLRLGGK